jgi:membrane protein
MSATFSLYLGHVANYTASYGALSAVIGLMMWISAVIVLIGAKLNAELNKSRWVIAAPSWPTPVGRAGDMENHNPCRTSRC